MAAAYPAAWFILAASNQDTFVNANKDDLLVYATTGYSAYAAPTQAVLLGVPSATNASGMRLTQSNAEVSVALSAPCLLVASSNSAFSANTIKLSPQTGVVVAGQVIVANDGTLNSNLVGVAQLQDGCITAAKLADGAITADKLGVTGAVSLDGMSVSSTSVDSNGTIALGYSNFDSTTYAVAQSSSNVTSINSGPGTSLSMCVGGTELATLNPDGDLSVSGGFTQTSDRNLKSDLQRVEGALDKLMQLNGYTFRMRSRPTGADMSAGLIAQEVQAVLPEAVRTSALASQNQALSLDYSAMSCLYVEAIKELYQMVQALQDRLPAALN